MKEYRSASEVIFSRTVFPSKSEIEGQIANLEKIKDEHAEDINELGLHLINFAIVMHEKDLSIYSEHSKKLGENNSPARLISETPTSSPDQMNKLGALVYLQTNAIVGDPAFSQENRQLMNKLENSLKSDIEKGI